MLWARKGVRMVQGTGNPLYVDWFTDNEETYRRVLQIAMFMLRFDNVALLPPVRELEA